ncbi:beta strand repeat-containing protein [Sulfitobacter sp.]|uniref:beta strand repeat-containing protein n=1 Tax=Sulfitobacter sp. TaxID=1903071 RepID=UPI003EF3DD09
MTDFVLTGYSSVARSLTGSDSGVITRDGELIVSGADAITATTGTNWITILGQVYAQGGGFAALDLGGTVAEVIVGRDGFVSSENSTGGTIDVNLASLFNLQNNGEIHSNNARAVDVTDTDGAMTVDIRNTGIISAFNSEAVFVDAGTGGIDFSNSGTIMGDSQTVELVLTGTGGDIDFLNSGTITGASGSAVSLNGGTSGRVTIINSGLLQGDDDVLTSLSTATVAIANSGSIISESNAISLGGGSDTVVNVGIIQGDVNLGDGYDTFDTRGGSFNDILRGGDGGDTYYLGINDVQITEYLGDTGTDMVYTAASHTLASNIEHLYLTDEGGAINGTGNAGDNSIIGNNSDNNMHGLSGDDSIYGNQGKDTLSGGTGDDFLSGGSDGDVLLGGDGIDWAGYGGSQGWVNVSLLTGFVGGGAGSDAIGDSFVSIENISGSIFDDRINGDHSSNYLSGSSGDDNLRGRGGADTLAGGSGSDTADYADSSAFVNVSLQTGYTGGGAGSHATGDLFSSIENLVGSQYADLLNGNSANNILEGRQGGDFLNGNDGDDMLSYASSGAFVNVSLLSGFAGGGAGSHAIGDTWSNMEDLRGSAHNDLLSGDNSANRLEGMAGNDSLRGNNGVDVFVFGDTFGNDTVQDFQDGAELFDFSDHTTVSAFADLSVSSSGGNALIGDGLGNQITVIGAAGLIDATDFTF